MQFPVIVGLRRSFFLRSTSATAHLLACAACAYLFRLRDFPVLALVLAAVLLLVAALHADRQLHPVFSRLLIHRDGSLGVFSDLHSPEIPVSLLPGALVHPWLLVLPLQVGSRRIRLVLAHDSADRENLRRMRVALRWLVPQSGDAAGGDSLLPPTQ